MDETYKMNLEQITRNAENQVAAALRNKVDRFMSSKKRDRRLDLLLDINNLAQDLVQITCAKVDLSLLEKKEVPPLPAKRNSDLLSTMVDITKGLQP